MSATRFAGSHTVAADVPDPGIPDTPSDPPAAPGETPPTLPATVPAAPSATYETLTGEGTATDTLPLDPSLPLALGVQFGEPTVFEADLGYETYIPRPGDGRRRLELVWFALTDAQKTTVVDFANDHLTEPWFWTYPGDGSPRTWRFASRDGKLKILKSEQAPGVHEIRIEVFEVL